ncbi:MAG: AAA family ATPase [Dehalococcoidia bacterium]|nr:AAA family ATPase [Dehalococcoidia bacterium]
MPKASTPANLPCPKGCGYTAFNQADLDAHVGFAHAGTPTPPPPPPVEKTSPPAPVPTASLVKETQARVLPAGIFIPEPQPDFYVSPQVARELHIIGKLTERGGIVNVKVIGPAGVGKTSLGWEFSAAFKRPCFEIHWGMYQEPSEVWGKDRLSMDKGTYYEQARMVDALETPGCVIINDEPNRCHPEVLNAMFAIWDWRRTAWVPDLRRMVKVAPGVTFFAAMNEGGEYIGTNPMDKAIRERFGRTIRLKWPPMAAEAKIIQKRTGADKDTAEKLAKFARDVRRNPKIGCSPSTRQLLVAAEDTVEGLPLQEAIMYAIVNDLDERVDRQALLQHLQVIGKIDDAWANAQEE